MKILIYIASLGAGGAEKVASLMANYWAEKNEVVLLTAAELNDDFFFISNKVKRQSTGFKPRKKKLLQKVVEHYQGIKSLRNTVKKIKPDIIISHMDIANVHMLLATINLNIPIIVEDHNNPQLKGMPQPWKFLKPFSYLFADKVILLLPELSHYYSKYLYRHQKFSYIPNPLNIPENIINSKDIVLPKPTFIAVGSLTYQKGLNYLLEAFAICHTKIPDWNLVILGDGPLMEDLINISKKLNIENNCLFLGKISNPYTIMSQADIYVMSSRYEGFPVALCEAMGLGLPCISFNCPTGPSNIIENNKNGLLIDYLDVDKLAKSMYELASDKKKQESLAKEAIKINNLLRLSTVMQKWDDVIKEII